MGRGGCRCLLVAVICSWASLRAAEPAADPDAIKFFESKVRPVLVARCLKCHGEAQQKGKLRLDSREAVLKGGESGEIVVSGKPATLPSPSQSIFTSTVT